jgi:tetratricopeptide (TPR) repeat protein
LFRHIVEVTRNNYIAHYHYGDALAKDKRLHEAAFHYQESLRINPRYKEPYNRLAKVFFDLDKFDEVITVCTNRLRIGKPEAAIYHRLGMAYTRKRSGSLAIKSFKECLRLDPDLAPAHRNLAKLVMGLKNPDAAIRHLTEAIRLNPNILLTHFNLALLLKNKGRTEEAITHFKEALRIKPGWVKAMNALAWILATHSREKFRNPLEAIQLAQQACELTYYQDPRSVDTLAAAYAAAGRFDDAVANAEMAVQLTASGDNKQRHRAIQNRLQLYKQKKPYRQPLTSKTIRNES